MRWAVMNLLPSRTVGICLRAVIPLVIIAGCHHDGVSSTATDTGRVLSDSSSPTEAGALNEADVSAGNSFPLDLRAVSRCEPGNDAGLVEDGSEPSDAAVFYYDWWIMFNRPLAAETVMERGDGSTPMSISSTQSTALWTAYKRVKASRPFQTPTCGAVDARVVLRFVGASGRTRWVAVGRECPLMQTDDHVCHPLDRALFRQLVELLGIRDRITTGRGRDLDMAKFL
jgi:hypothetical protein